MGTDGPLGHSGLISKSASSRQYVTRTVYRCVYGDSVSTRRNLGDSNRRVSQNSTSEATCRGFDPGEPDPNHKGDTVPVRDKGYRADRLNRPTNHLEQPVDAGWPAAERLVEDVLCAGMVHVPRDKLPPAGGTGPHGVASAPTRWRDVRAQHLGHELFNPARPRRRGPCVLEETHQLPPLRNGQLPRLPAAPTAASWAAAKSAGGMTSSELSA
ncbi:hypothetical protein AHiyo4_02460 [Arthrobacter sp. Hiyo4]|nr:hypothetical protein AHiyo4_02460 [Arthrobacter sp. Hiyo4]